MRWLNSLHRSERGASAVFLGILLVPLIGFLAIALDVGALYAERAQLQNGADAAAIAIARDCADEGCDTPSALAALAALAARFTKANANDRAANVDPPIIDLDAQTVTVIDSTRTDTGEDAIQHPFASLIGTDSTTVDATATAEWGHPGDGPAVLPLALSYCEFLLFGALNDEDKITIRYDENHPCTRDGAEIPGGFGWLDQIPGQCEVLVDLDADVVPSRPGNSQPVDCEETLADLEGRTILIPIFDSSTEPGANGVFHIYAFASFKVTGWKFAGGNRMPLVNVDNYPGCGCSGGNSRFIQGYFKDWVSVDSAFELDGPDLNADVVRLIIPPEPREMP
ncbi:TadE/TadG family type IV pilus assembly protein [Cryobacterium sp. Y29]|uniref:TadE/TadG family type IV pilus assembly protein n=1 Tax=Cryobacterium sp. Y29 TaxID=2048285 RepID=UPI001304991D|nr:pilus assembly protein TadG-related protein [Cryobacterium sp. Y29]